MENGLSAVYEGESVRYKNGEVRNHGGYHGMIGQSETSAEAAKQAILRGKPGHTAAGHQSRNPELRKERQLYEAIEIFALYLQAERDGYYGQGEPLRGEPLKTMRGYFNDELLNKVRVCKLTKERVPNPWFYSVAKERGYGNLPDLPHLASVTFLDVIVFNEKFSTRDLFHGLVHAAQVQSMGVNEFASLFVRGFLQARSYFLVPLKAHAFSLDARFAANPGSPFPVEDEIRTWWRTGRYSY